MKMKSKRFIAFFFSVLLPISSAQAMEYDLNEASPDEIAADLGPYLGLENNFSAISSEDPGGRAIIPIDFSKYKIVVDVFRQSGKNPVLGNYDEKYEDALTSNFIKKNDFMKKEFGKSRFNILANTEFMVVSVDGRPRKANLVSAALEKKIPMPVKVNGVTKYVNGTAVTEKSLKTTPNGNFMLTVLTKIGQGRGADGKLLASDSYPFPFRTSTTYDRSAMFWGLHIFGGYLIHSTPHTSQLGRPASMGCVRQSFPDAMELWDLVANHSEGRLAMVRIHEMHSLEAYTRLREIVYDPHYEAKDPAYALTDDQLSVTALPSSEWDMKWLVGQLNGSFRKIHDYVAKYGGNHMGVGYAWIDPMTHKSAAPVFPKCGTQDCFKLWGDPLKQQQADLKDDASREAIARAAAGLAAAGSIPEGQ